MLTPVLALALAAGACSADGDIDKHGLGPGPGGVGGNGGGGKVTPLADVAASTPEGGVLPPTRRMSVNAAEVLRRAWPDRVTPDGPWPATVRGAGDWVEVTPASLDDGERDRGRITDGMRHASFVLGSGRDSNSDRDESVPLVFPDGTHWFPRGEFTVDLDGDLPFSRVTAHNEEITVVVSQTFGALVTARGPVTVHGPFQAADGRTVDQLVLPQGTKAVKDTADIRPAAVIVKAEAGTAIVVDTSLDTEAAVAGTTEAIALGRTWTGLIAAAQGHGMKAVAIRGEQGWSLLAGTTSALQLWIDVWPVADTVLSASVTAGDPANCEPTYCSSTVRWTNTGHASSQVFEAEGTGPGAKQVSFDLNKSLGHDAGLGVRRGDRVINLDGGADVDSNQPPGGRVSRRVDHGRDSATLVLRGNFPEVRLVIT